jgi:hypothetical protein
MIAHFGYKPTKKTLVLSEAGRSSASVLRFPERAFTTEALLNLAAPTPQHVSSSFAAVRRVNLLTNLAGLTDLVGRLLLSCLLMDRELDLGAQFQLQTNYLSWISKVGSTPNNYLILKFLFRQVSRIFYNIPKFSSFSFTNFFFFKKNIFWKFQHV